MREDVKERETATVGSGRGVSRRRLESGSGSPLARSSDRRQGSEGKGGYKTDAKLPGLSRARVCTEYRRRGVVSGLPPPDRFDGTARGDASVVGSSAATLCEGMPAPPAVMSPPTRAWWHRRDERSNSGGPGCGSRSRRPSFMLEGGKPYDWRGVEPNALGGVTRAPQSASVSPEKRN